MYVARSITGEVLYEAESVEAMQAALKADGWEPRISDIRDEFTGKFTPVVDESGLEWQRLGAPQKCGYIGVSIMLYVTIEEA